MNAQQYASKIRAREYASPRRARAMVTRSPFSGTVKRKLNELITEWEQSIAGSALSAPVVAGDAAPDDVAAGAVEDAEVVTPPESVDERGNESESAPLRLTLNARVRVKLTLHGMSLLYQHYKEHAPQSVLAAGGVWETQLWELAAVLAGAGMGDQPIENNVLEVLDPRLGFAPARKTQRLVMEYAYGSAFVAPPEAPRGAHP